jgi:DNA-directed RNA polymerase specialized sigma24 family protein
MAETSFADVNFGEVLERLTLHAQNLSTALLCVGLVEKVLPGGDSAADLAYATVFKFIDPLDLSVRWSDGRGQPTTSGVLAYLRQVLERDFLDLKKSSRFRTTIYEESTGDEDGGTGVTLDQLAGTFETPEGTAIRRQQVEWILKHFDTEPELKEIAKLQFSPEGYNAFSNQDLAKLLDTTVREIENRKKRIKLKLKKLVAACRAREAKHV